MAFSSSSSSSVRLFATASLLVMLLMASGMGIIMAAPGPRMCSSRSVKFKGLCIFANGNCNTVCKSEGFSNGSCTGSFNPICTCNKPCHC